VISGKTLLIAHLGFPTETFKSLATRQFKAFVGVTAERKRHIEPGRPGSKE